MANVAVNAPARAKRFPRSMQTALFGPLLATWESVGARPIRQRSAGVSRAEISPHPYETRGLGGVPAGKSRLMFCEEFTLRRVGGVRVRVGGAGPVVLL